MRYLGVRESIWTNFQAPDCTKQKQFKLLKNTYRGHFLTRDGNLANDDHFYEHLAAPPELPHSEQVMAMLRVCE